MKVGWKYSTIGEEGKLLRGANFLKTDFVENGFPCIHYGQIHTKFGTYTNNHLTCIPEVKVNKDRLASYGDLVIAITSEDVLGSCKCTAWLGNYDVAVGAHAAIYKHNFIPAYISYYFASPQFYKEKEKYTHGFKVVEIKPADIAKINVPVPPVSEQQQIVDFLDAEFAKIDELKNQAEQSLQNAKDLFQAALKEMLTPKEGWKEYKMQNLCSIESKLVDPKLEQYNKLLHVGGANIVSYTGELIDLKTAEEEGLESGKFYFETDVVLYNKIRPYLVKVSRPDFIGLCSADMYPLTPTPIVCKDYLYYILISKDFTDYAILGSGRAGMPKVNRACLFAYETKVPTMEEQKNIASKLDNLAEILNHLQSNYTRTIQLCADLKQALLRQVFE